MDAAKARDEETRPHNSTNPTTIFSQLRSFSNNLAVGSLFNSTAPSPSSSPQNLVSESWNNCDLPKAPNQLNVKGGDIMEEGHTPTPSRPSSPRRFASVKSIFTNLTSRTSRNTQSVRISVTQTQIQTEEETETPRYDPLTSPFGSEFTTSSENSYRLEPSSYSPSEYQQVSASGSFGSSELDDTPPLTPESLVTDFALLSPASKNAELAYGYAYDYNEPHVEGDGQDGYMQMQVDECDAYMRPHSMEIKEGKKPERPIVCREAPRALKLKPCF